jgi:hypothetical protein
MNIFCKLCDDIDLASLHYVIFIQLIAISSNEVMSFGSEQFINTSINKLIEPKDKDPFMIFEEYFFGSVLVNRKSYNIHFKDL